MSTEPIRQGDLVLFRQNHSIVLAGTVIRGPWGPAADPYLTLRTIELTPRTFTRCTSACTPISLADLRAACDRIEQRMGPGIGAVQAAEQVVDQARGVQA